MNEAAAVSLSNVLLRHSATLDTLNLGWSIQNMTIPDWLAFLQPLQDPSCRLKKLNLNSNAITDEVAAVLTNALANNSKLRELDLGYNRDVTATGWVGFSTVLRNPNSALEILDLGGNRINDHVMTSFALQDP
jgi:Leucine-rich repeat (LRR) protein